MANIHYSIVFKGSKRALLAALYRLPSILAGNSGDNLGIGRAFYLHLAHGVFDRIYNAYLIKSGGGTDDLGIRWKPLSPSTIASRAIRGEEATALGFRRGSPRPSLTEAQDRIWRGIYHSTVKRLSASIGLDASKAQAAKLAWAILKSQGAKTQKQLLAQRSVLILIDSERLLNSLEPGAITDDSYTKPREQHLHLGKGFVTLGSNVPYAGPQHTARPFWPHSLDITPWVQSASQEALDVVVSKVTNYLHSGVK